MVQEQKKQLKDIRICVVGLGYVGLPLAVEFGKLQKVIGFDINKKKLDELREGTDSTGEMTSQELKKADIEYTSDEKKIGDANFIIVAVPTPITKAHAPDTSYLESSSRIIGKNIKKGTIVVYESTVYPGATEEVCVPIIEKASGLRCGKDFKVGYSPERINPGDKEHTVKNIVKVVSGMDEGSRETIAMVYGSIIRAGVFKAADIKTAEAAKVIENIQRDLNIALMNELSLIFERIGINTKDVIEAAGTKWNFHKYHPGLVGGHCIGVDPYYLTYKAQELGYQPQIILAGRAINEHMAKHVAELVVKGLSKAGKVLKESKVLLLGLTFKENVRDSRNSKAKDLIRELEKFNISVIGCDPCLSDEEVKRIFNVKNICLENLKGKVDCVILATPHDIFKKITLEKMRSIMTEKPVLVDVKSLFGKISAEKAGFIYSSL
ncbi:nucleotide sugar dehydrogenase [Candidatus Woesearchaeota archaeon]|nr:nucleotide sugar dehydrogenase [Candidatus Woesearchaeota archaeon]